MIARRALVGILLLPAMVVTLGLATRSDQALNFILGPVDDPQYFCITSDPIPVADVGSPTTLRECSAGKTVRIGHGQTIAIDLRSGGIDSTTSWHDFHVSGDGVLQTVVAPSNTSAAGASHEIALYRAVKPGQSNISAVQVRCGWNGGCGRDHRWKVTVDVD